MLQVRSRGSILFLKTFQTFINVPSVFSVMEKLQDSREALRLKALQSDVDDAELAAAEDQIKDPHTIERDKMKAFK